MRNRSHISRRRRALWTVIVTRLDDLHVWEVTSGMPALSGHIFVNHDIDCHDVRRTVEAMLHDRFDITHTTLQTDHAAIGQAESANCAESREAHPSS